MRRPSYKAAIAWIALNDDAGGETALDPDAVHSYLSTTLVADLFEVDQARVARDVIAYRKRHDAMNPDDR